MITHKTAILTAMLAGGMLAMGAAHAHPINAFLGSGPTLLSDNSAEQFIDVTETGTLDVGDRLRGIFQIETFESLITAAQTDLSATPYELKGLFDIEVIQKDVFNLVDGSGNVIGQQFQFTFGAYDGFATEADNSGWTAGEVDGLAAVFFADDRDNDFDFARLTLASSPCVAARGETGTAAIAALEGCATNGDMMWAMGFDATPGTGWATGLLATDDPAAIGGLPLGQAAGQFNVSLNVLQYGVGRELLRNVDSTIAAGEFVDAAGSGGLLEKGTSQTPFDLFNNIDVTVNPVPEPGTVALFGLGALGLGLLGWRRSRRHDAHLTT